MDASYQVSRGDIQVVRESLARIEGALTEVRQELSAYRLAHAEDHRIVEHRLTALEHAVRTRTAVGSGLAAALAALLGWLGMQRQ